MHRLTLDDFLLFDRLALLGSLSAVARERDVPVSQVSRALARLEKTCAARLVRRSTHGMTLTAEGDTFLHYARRMSATLEDMDGEFAARTGQVAGAVRVAASTVIAQYQLLPGLVGLGRRHPGLCIELEIGDHMADLVRDRIDIALRTAVSLPDTVVARPIGTLSRALYAAPSYLAAAGVPASVDDLRRHQLVTNTSATVINQWPFMENGKRFIYPAKGRWRSNDTNTTAGMVLAGLGIGRLARVVALPLVREGRLVPVLPGSVDIQTVTLYAVTAGTRHRLPKIKACLDYWEEWFSRGEEAG